MSTSLNKDRSRSGSARVAQALPENPPPDGKTASESMSLASIKSVADRLVVNVEKVIVGKTHEVQ